MTLLLRPLCTDLVSLRSIEDLDEDFVISLWYLSWHFGRTGLEKWSS